ncbi:hypothetical protein LOD99_7266 [Oopsacas minuta]|uniref:Uncharacterized protein n=1 Tax=Oopsacas minuta TaxID=111878 RepID=A0AAV7JUJ7_9METZ|nr:hypothetical protein LOD99_7266 [Oopsacas minuta]
MERCKTTNKNMSLVELMYHFKEEHRLREQAEAALVKANRTSHRYQQVANEYRIQIEKLVLQYMYINCNYFTYKLLEIFERLHKNKTDSGYLYNIYL